MLYTFWTIHWSKLLFILHLLDYMLVRIDHYYTPFGLYIYWSELIINTRHISLSFPFFLRAPIYLEPVASEEHKVLRVSKKGNSNHNQQVTTFKTRPGVNYAKECFEQVFLYSYSGLVQERVSPIVVITMGQPITIFLCIGPFLAWYEQPTKQPGHP